MNTIASENIRAFKLSNGDTVNPSELEKQIADVCHYIKYVVVSGEGEDQPLALIFPDKGQFTHPGYKITPEEGCFCPRSIDELGKCLTGCLAKVNSMLNRKLKYSAIINTASAGEDTLENKQLSARLQKMFAENIPSDKDVYVIRLNNYK